MMDDPLLKIVFVGHVDHGKSSLIGRILAETGSLPDGKMESLRQACAAQGQSFEYAYVLDSLAEEQEQNITIDTTQINFHSAQRLYVIIDAPGHQEFLKNMITGAANAEAAILVVAADEGMREQSRRHAQLVGLLGIRQVIVAINKMDLVRFDQATYRRIEQECSAFLREVELTARAIVPVSAQTGDNLTRRSIATPWYPGVNLLEALDKLDPVPSSAEKPLRLTIQDV